MNDDKKMLFEAMHKVTGMPLKENFDQDVEEFTPHGTYTVSNSGGYEIMLNDAGDAAKVRDAYGSDNPQTSDWLEIEYVPSEGGESEPVIDPNGYNIPLSQVMRINGMNEEMGENMNGSYELGVQHGHGVWDAVTNDESIAMPTADDLMNFAKGLMWAIGEDSAQNAADRFATNAGAAPDEIDNDPNAYDRKNREGQTGNPDNF